MPEIKNPECNSCGEETKKIGGTGHMINYVSESGAGCCELTLYQCPKCKEVKLN